MNLNTCGRSLTAAFGWSTRAKVGADLSTESNSMTTKKFKLASHEIKPIVGAMGGCVATDRITVEGYPVRFMYREEPDNEYDSYSCS